ncbi:P27 family phage terminase small subunit [Saccharopolyspora hattusasensis]|uniref:P27 family phage terminase small subunit n=1 Tax=Saccharopolyspora hattusasensis TaxID=1128679 RepID=UPI003D989EAC
MPPDQEVACPEWLSDEAKLIWDRLAPGLIAQKVLTPWDVDAFTVPCESLARYKAATALVNGSALLVQGSTGLVRNPALQVQSEAERVFLAYAVRVRVDSVGSAGVED